MLVKDAARIADIHTRAWQIAFKGILDQNILDEIDIKEREAMWRDKIIPNPKRVNLVFENEETIIGWSAFGRSSDDNKSQELIGIYVDPVHFREGVGTELWKATSQLMLEKNPDFLVLWVLEENKQARDFYEKMGFSDTEHTRKVSWLGGAIEVKYIKHS